MLKNDVDISTDVPEEFQRGSPKKKLSKLDATDLRLCWHSKFYILGKRFKCFFVRRGPCRPELAKDTKVRV